MTAGLTHDARTFAVLRGLTVIGGLAALLLVPPRPEHRTRGEARRRATSRSARWSPRGVAGDRPAEEGR